MQLTTSVGLVATQRRLHIETQEPVQFVDITAEVEASVRSAGLRNGIVTVFSRHTTGSVRIQEDEPLLLDDLVHFLRRAAPAAHPYGHNDFRVRTEHMHDDESPNGHSHCLQLLLGSSETIPVDGGELQLGSWQRVFFVELDGPRRQREILIQTLGTSE